MYKQLATKVGISSGGSVVSDPVPMKGFNTVQVDLVVFSGEVRVYIQQSDDLQDWSLKDTYAAVIGPSHKMFSSTETCCAYVRVKWEEATGSGNAIVASGINQSVQ